jgi:ERCC4-type nuclease
MRKEKRRVEIYADEREDREVIEEIRALGGIVRIKLLPVGDFLLSSRVACERKTRRDFEKSIIDMRLFKQLENMKENFSSPLLVVEGRKAESEEIISRAALLGAYASVIADYGIPIFFTSTPKATAELYMQ